MLAADGNSGICLADLKKHFKTAASGLGFIAESIYINTNLTHSVASLGACEDNLRTALVMFGRGVFDPKPPAAPQSCTISRGQDIATVDMGPCACRATTVLNHTEWLKLQLDVSLLIERW